jgi:hypothetical protein
MCPNRQVISLYFDGELPSPWKEKLEAHLESCADCKNILAGYRKLGEELGELPAETVQSAMDRVWENLELRPTISRRSSVPVNKIWKRSITLPLPAVAAAAVVIIFAVFAILTRAGGGPRYLPQNPMVLAGMELDDYGTLPIQDMNGVLQYLSSQDNDDIAIIRLPESRRFSRNGEPALINAADYSRRNVHR